MTMLSGLRAGHYGGRFLAIIVFLTLIVQQLRLGFRVFQDDVEERSRA